MRIRHPFRSRAWATVLPRIQTQRRGARGFEGSSLPHLGRATVVKDPPEAAAGRVLVRWGSLSRGVIGFYLFLILLLLYLILRTPGFGGSSYLVPVVELLLLIYLARYLSTHYRLDAETLRARRLFGSRRLRLAEITRIQRANLRTLGAVGFLGTWGWHGRVWSPLVGQFDTVYTGSDGLLISGDGRPVFISPRDPDGFQRELDRRVRTENGGAEVDLAPV